MGQNGPIKEKKAPQIDTKETKVYVLLDKEFKIIDKNNQ